MARHKRTVFILTLFLVCMFSGAVYGQDGDELIEAVQHQDLDAVKKLVEAGVDVNYQEPSYATPGLTIACMYNYADIAKYLVAKGADVNLKNKDGDTPLMAAASSSKELVELLLEKGADVRAAGRDSLTALTHAITGVLAERVTTDVAALLLEKGANVDEAAPSGAMQGYTCLMMAARNARPDIVKFLVGKGANVNAKAGDGNTPLSLARKAKDEDMVKLLVELGAKDE